MKKLLYSVPGKIIIGFLICIILSSVSNLLLKKIFASIDLEKDTAKMIRVLMNFSAALIAYWLFSKYFEKRKASDLDTKFLLKESVFGFFSALLTITIVILILFLLGYYKPVTINNSFFLQLYSLIVIFSMAGFEEILMRGILYRIVEEKWGTNLALLISSGLFGLWHLTNENATWISVFAISIYGTLPCLMFSLKKRLWYPIFLHTGWNYAQAFFGTTLSGMDVYATYGFIQSKIEGPQLLTGGVFGPESSILTIILAILLFVWLYLRMLREKAKQHA